MPSPCPKAFRTLRSRVFALFEQGRYEAALAEATRLRRRFPRRGEIPFWIACGLCETGRPDEALDVLRSASDQGLWWPAEWLRDDEDLAALRGSDGLEAVVAASERLRAARGEDRTTEALVLPPRRTSDEGERARTEAPGAGAPRPAPGLLVALHGWGEQAPDFVEPWRPATGAGLLVAVPESSQELTPGFFVWDDRERARDDVVRALSSLRRHRQVDEQRGLYAGFSQGGGLAVSWALAGGPVPTGAFLALGTGLSDIDPDALRALDEAAARGARGRLIVGDADEALADARELHETLRGGGVPCDLEVVPGLGHDLPGDLEIRLAEALSVLLPPP